MNNYKTNPDYALPEGLVIGMEGYFYDSPWDFENESLLNAALIGAYKDGFEMQERDGNTYHFPYIAIEKSDYERVMGEV